MMPFNILSLGKYVVVPILTEWLSFNDLFHFDSACKKSDLQLLSLLYCEFSCLFDKFLLNHELNLSLDFIMWKSKRHLDLMTGIVRVKESSLHSIRPFVMDSSWLLNWFSVSSFFAPGLFDRKVQLQSSLRSVKSVRIDSCSKSNTDVLVEVLKICPLLHDLSLGMVEDLATIVTIITSHCLELRSFSCDVLEDEQLRRLVTQCTKLTSLRCMFTQERSIEYLQQCSSLNSLSISKQFRFDSVFQQASISKQVAKSSLFSFALYCGRTLTYLDLASQISISDECYLYIGQHCPNLRCLLMPTSQTVNGTVVTTLTQGLPCLTSLSVELSFEDGFIVLPALAAACPDIVSLKLRFAALVGGLFPNLQSLSYGSAMPSDCIECIVSSCPNLTSLDAHVNYHWDFDPFGRIENLQYLKISSVFYRSMTGLEELIPRLTFLREIDIQIPLYGNVAISILIYCRLLTVMKFEAHYAFQYHDFVSFAELCGKLKGLWLDNGSDYLDASIVTQIVKYGKKLRRLCLVGPRLQVWSMNSFRASLQKLNPAVEITIQT